MSNNNQYDSYQDDSNQHNNQASERPAAHLYRHFKVGDFVHFYDSYKRHPSEATRRTGKVTSILNQYYGVMPINGRRELFFKPEELMRIDKPRAIQQPLITESME